ncbi:Na/Pi cotransporter family protein [Arenimonas sp.]|nr:Na/Pi cotransporter family protein [Candidatus Parcubacteria bacterium]
MFSTLLIILATIMLFLFSVSKFSRNIETVAGEKMKYYLSKTTETPARSTFTGFIINAIFQSNTAITVTLVGLVNAGLVTFPGALGIIIGSNVGNTLTSQLIAFNIMAFAPVFIVIGFLMKRFKNPIKHYSGPVFYFGLLFLSLSYLQLLIAPFIANPEVLSFISSVDSLYIAIIIGIVGAGIFQSSTAISVLAITFAAQGVLNFDQAFGIVVGSGIGTTVTALIASFVMNTASQRTAFAHLWFNVMSVIITIVLFNPVKTSILSLNTSLTQSIANAHLFISIITAVFLLLTFKWYVKFIELIIPQKGFFHKSRAVLVDKI